jgi:hypothetical protein
VARIEDIERRLQNWARWVHGAGSGGLGYGSTWNTEAGSSRFREAVIPTVDCEASATNEAIEALDATLRQTVRQVYLTGDSGSIDAAKLGVSEATVKSRIWDVHRRLSRWFTERDATARAERQRVEALARASKAC